MPFKDKQRLKVYFQEYNQKPKRKLYRQLWYLKNRYPDKSEWEFLTIIELRKCPNIKSLLNSWKYRNWFKCFATSKNRDYCQRGSKVCYTWKKKGYDIRKRETMLKIANMIIKLGIENTYWKYKVGCYDIDVKGYTRLFPKKSYVSNRIGSVHFYFLYKESDTRSKKLRINDFKADFLVSKYVVSPLSLHPTGNLYRVKGIGCFYVEKFEKASEALTYLKREVELFQFARQQKQERRQLQNQIEISTQQNYVR